MARIRSIKPEIHMHEGLWDLEVSSGLPLFRVFTGLFGQADREGRFEWRPRRLQASILPYWPGDLSACLDALMAAGFILRYGPEGAFGCIPTWKKHQRPHHTEPVSVIPAPLDNGEDTVRTPFANAQEGKGGEGKGMEGVCVRGKETDKGKEPEPPPLWVPPSNEPLCAAQANPLRPAYERFRKAYPRHRWMPGDALIWSAYREANPEEAALMAGLAAWQKSDEWGRGVIPNALTFLRQRYWERPPDVPRLRNAKGAADFTGADYGRSDDEDAP